MNRAVVTPTTGSLKVAVMAAAGSTPLAEALGTVEMTIGGVVSPKGVTGPEAGESGPAPHWLTARTVNV